MSIIMITFKKPDVVCACVCACACASVRADVYVLECI